MSETYSTVMWGDASNAAIPVPLAVVEALGAGRRPRLVVTVNGFEFTRELGSMGGQPMIGFSQVRRRESGIQPGDALEVTLRIVSPGE